MNNNRKTAIRQEISQRLAAFPPARRTAAERSLGIKCAVFLRKHFRPGDTIMGYYPLPDEPDIVPLLETVLESGYRLALPVITFPPGGQLPAMQAKIVENLHGDLVSNRWNIPEPADFCRPAEMLSIRAVIVPGRAFTLDGKRLGRGKGFYDRFLPQTPARRIALAFKCQIFPEADFPQEEHDITMHEVLTA